MVRNCFRLFICFVLLIVVVPISQVHAQEISESNIAVQAFFSTAGQDGWVLESNETSGTGGTVNATVRTIRVGDDAQNRQYRGILSFNTSSLPDNAVVLSATLTLKQQGVAGNDPFATHGKLLVEIRKPFWGGSVALALEDFQAESALNTAGVVGADFIAKLQKPELVGINLLGNTQLRLGFQLDDDNDLAADYLSFFSGDASDKPMLEVKYYVPSLPNDLYFKGKTGEKFNNLNVYQIYRLAKDGKTITQVTHEPGFGIVWFSISPVNGSIAYTTGSHKILTLDRNGANRTVLTEQAKNIYTISWAPNGQSLAYRTDTYDIYTYTPSTSENTLLMAATDDFSFLDIGSYSPDSKKLIIEVGNSSAYYIYDFTSETLLPLVRDQASRHSCLGHVLTWMNANTFFCSFSRAGVETLLPGLWRVNADNGVVKDLLVSTQVPFHLVGAPRQDASGKIYYLYGQYTGNHAPEPTLSLVWSQAGTPANRVAVRPEGFAINNAFWTLDNKNLLILTIPEEQKPALFKLMPVNPALPITTFPAEVAERDGHSFQWMP